jgi:hypothetical protein
MKMSLITLGFFISGTVGFAVMPQQLHALPQPTIINPLPKPTITEITLERTVCYGFCPIYKVILRSDNTATYIGMKFVERQGTYKAYISGFEHLAKIIEARKYFSLRNRYTKPVTDMPSAITSVVRNGKRKTVDNYGNSGPIELWEIETLIDGLIANARWEKVSNSSPKPLSN